MIVALSMVIVLDVPPRATRTRSVEALPLVSTFPSSTAVNGVVLVLTRTVPVVVSIRRIPSGYVSVSAAH